MIKKILIILGIVAVVIGGIIFVANYTRTVNIYKHEYKDGTVFIDLDRDEKEEEIILHRNGKNILINNKTYLINKHYNSEIDAFSVMRNGSDNYYYILDINKDKYLDIVLETIDERVSPPISYYTIFNYDNGIWKEIADISLYGSMPSKIKVMDNTIKFDYIPREAKEGYIETKTIELDV